MINVSTWSIRNPLPVLMFFVLLCFAGVLGFRAMKVQHFPDIELPMVTVAAALPGATPSQLENEVARKLENAIATLSGLKHIYTLAQDGNLLITTEFRLEKPVQEAVDDVRSAVASVRADLPADLLDPVVNKVDLAASPVLAFTIRSPRMDEEALSWFVDDQVARSLLAVRGVGAVTRVGGVSRELRVSLDPQRLEALGVSAAEISRRLRDMQLESAGGRTDLGGAEQPVRLLALAADAAELAAFEVVLNDGRRLRLDEVARVEDTVAERRAAAFLDGEPVVGFEVARSRGESEVEVAASVHAALDQLRARRPDIEISEAFNFVTPVAEEYRGSLQLLYEGAALAVIVVWFFLRDWRATLVAAVALPLSVIPAFAGMEWLGFSINIVTLLALSLVVGVLVDDAIVEVENIVRHLRMGKSAYQAAMEAAEEIGLAVIATTFTLIAVFLPTAFMSGIAGKFFRQFGWTASLAVFASLVVARMLTPMMAAYVMKADAGERPPPRWLEHYERWVKVCLRHRGLTLLAALAFFVGSLSLIPLLPTGFMTADDNSQTQVYLELAPGVSLAQTIAVAEHARQRVMTVDHVRSIYTTVGGGSAGGDPLAGLASGEVRRATLTIQLAPRAERPVKQQIEREIRAVIEDLPGVRSKVGLGGTGEKYILVLAGDEPVALQQAALAVERELRALPGLGSIASTASLIRPEIAVRPDFARAAELGVSSAALADTLRVATVGDYEVGLAKLNLAQRQVPIRVQLDESARQQLASLERLAVPGAKGPVMLGQVARLEVAGGPAVINRYDRLRNINFEIELSGAPLGEVTATVAALPSVRNLPPGVSVVEVGDAEVMEELFSGFSLAMLVGVLCIYIVLVLLFHDLLHPFTILVALPLSLGGAFVALLATHHGISMPSLIGLIMLMGIATKNSI
ncbi:MAG: efflux RND transporter permease subunit, partial [Thauera sp.]|nr:efflux RND transporter permease subunit [Thauera sp.]